MEPNLKFEIKRKFIHIFALLYIGIYLYFANRFNHNIGLLSLTIVLAFFLVLEYFRVLKQKRIPIFHIFWRESEKNRLGGQVYFIIGAIIASLSGNVENIFEISNIFGFFAILLAAINIFGGFLVTQRMLQMYKKNKKNK